MLERHKEHIRNVSPYVYIGLGLLVIFLILSTSRIQRVGDGGEYYALYYAWDTTSKPWMSEPAYNAYDELYNSNQINAMLPRAWLESAFPDLIIGMTSDFNHFWFYSFLAFLCANILSFFGITLQAHGSFLALHYFLLAALTSLSFRYFRWRGVLTIALMTLASPMLWYLDKVHTELFTYSLVLSSIILIYSKAYLPSALFLAMASTQNPSFALIAVIPVFKRIVSQHKKPYTVVDAGILTAIALLILAHPVYYFTRYGVVTPQLLAGGASIGENLSYFYIWLIDPDLGLLPNWPLGLAAIILASGIWITQIKERSAGTSRTWVTFFFIYLLVNFLAHSSTTNLNSGATPGVARYALWYLPLAFPAVYMISGHLTRKSRGSFILVPVVIAISALSAKEYNPRLAESYSTPTPFSVFVQSKLPWLYNPPPEVFLERYSGHVDPKHLQTIRGVVGPDCRKLLLLPGDSNNVTSPKGCLYDTVKLDKHIQHLSKDITLQKYTRLDEADMDKLLLSVSPDLYKVGLEKNGNFILDKGWGDPEPWGVWSIKKTVKLSIPCNDQQFYSSSKELILSMKIQSFGKQGLTISSSDNILWKNEINGQPRHINLNIPQNNCKKSLSSIVIEISNPTSPFDLGQSSDTRNLGIGFLEFQIK